MAFRLNPGIRIVLLAALAGCADMPTAPVIARASVAAAPSDLFMVIGLSNARGPYGLATYQSLRDSVGSFSAWPTFAVEYRRLTGRTVDVVNARVGGSSQTTASDLSRAPTAQNGSWDRRGRLWDASVALLDSVRPTRNFKGIIYVMGEADAGAIDRGYVTRSQYERALADMIARYRARYGPIPFYIIRSGRPANRDTPGYRAIRAAQTRVADNDPLTYMPFANAVNFATRGMMVDNVHWNIPAQQLVGRMAARSAASN